MSPRLCTAQPERSVAKSKASLLTLRLRRSRGAVYPERSSTSALRAYAQNERKRRAKSVHMTFVHCDTGCEILPVPPVPKEGTSKPPFVKGAAQRGGICVEHCTNLVWFDLERAGNQARVHSNENRYNVQCTASHPALDFGFSQNCKRAAMR
jgi:hypothetical protein